ncbi:succinate dehydrogenase assembly factor 2 [Seohaeicola saemankumensis]|uniref:succinate dehydrogenase assembly factor 2 n=1 Tax=Seohaeicola saemankumensis TaxID=481181 RepID=UPI001E458195|nr:succinate dehydrogenase assembly factor 2 [Seohaeicola saemankumensis]MCD1625924.1 succinate dehydrogenase assembly factor 2 [Seohaeicola saemankumensis]
MLIEQAPQGELPETRLRRLVMRSMRRGIKEMDVILSRFAETRLAGLDADMLDSYDALLRENDHDLYYWVSGVQEPPEAFAPIVGEIRSMLTGNSHNTPR